MSNGPEIVLSKAQLQAYIDVLDTPDNDTNPVLLAVNFSQLLEEIKKRVNRL